MPQWIIISGQSIRLGIAKQCRTGSQRYSPPRSGLKAPFGLHFAWADPGRDSENLELPTVHTLVLCTKHLEGERMESSLHGKGVLTCHRNEMTMPKKPGKKEAETCCKGQQSGLFVQASKQANKSKTVSQGSKLTYLTLVSVLSTSYSPGFFGVFQNADSLHNQGPPKVGVGSLPRMSKVPRSYQLVLNLPRHANFTQLELATLALKGNLSVRMPGTLLCS